MSSRPIRTRVCGAVVRGDGRQVLTPNYSKQSAAVLDRLEGGDDDELLHAVCDAIDLTCDSPGDRRARGEQLRTSAGTPIWKVVVRTRCDEWVVLWWPRGSHADIYFIGAL
jgi:hypothetical protein